MPYGWRDDLAKVQSRQPDFFLRSQFWLCFTAALSVPFHKCAKTPVFSGKISISNE